MEIAAIPPLEQIEEAVQRLSPVDYEAFRAWFTAYEAERWDRQIEEDLDEGRLDEVIALAEQAYQAGEAKPL